MTIKIKQEEKILYQHFQKCLETVSDLEYYRIFADEKYVHSMQVAGVGNYLLKHEFAFKKRTPQQLKNAKLSYFFHDIGRFEEITRMYFEKKNNSLPQKHDHGVLGYDILKLITPYNIDEIILPVKHHGHMIEDFYEDAEYQKIDDKNKQEEIKHNIFLARDADKIANFYLLKKMYHNEHYRHLFLGDIPDTNISQASLDDILNLRIVAKKNIQSISDKILSYISWIFDLNYKYSFYYCKKLKLIEFFLDILNQHNQDKLLQEKIEEIINTYVNNQYQQLGD